MYFHDVWSLLSKARIHMAVGLRLQAKGPLAVATDLLRNVVLSRLQY